MRFDPLSGEVLTEDVIPVRTRLAFTLSERYLQHVQGQYEELELSSPLSETTSNDQHQHQLAGSLLYTRPLLLVDHNYTVELLVSLITGECFPDTTTAYGIINLYILYIDSHLSKIDGI